MAGPQNTAGGAVAGGALPGEREGQTFAGRSLVARYASLVKLPHTLFALPFAGLGAVLASYTSGERVSAIVVLWIILAFTAARFAAMAFNRIVDRDLDAQNPRTRMRELPAGQLTVGQTVVALILACVLFVFASFQLNSLCGWLSPVALAWILFYSYTKRFTEWSHNVLGLALGIAPVGGYLAIAGQWSQPWYALPILAAAVMFWVAGFDVIYSIQDIEFDREAGLHSMAARRGADGAILRARIFHAIALALFVSIWALDLFPLGLFYMAGVAVMFALLLYENWAVRHAAVQGLDRAIIDRAFFRSNVAVSLSLFLLTLTDRLLALMASAS